jgi:seryl-tRNA synthetase
MTIWEKAVVNVQKGLQKINTVSAFFSERIKAEIAIVRLRIRIDEIQTQIDELYRTIGRRVVDLKNRGEIPKASEQLLRDEDIVSSMNELVEQKKEIEDLLNEIKIEQEARKPAPKQKEDSLV